MDNFTYFPKFECNAAFLNVINFTEGCKPGHGLCENMARYSKVSLSERKAFIDSMKEAEAPSTEEDTDDDAASVGSDAAASLDETQRQ